MPPHVGAALCDREAEYGHQLQTAGTRSGTLGVLGRLMAAVKREGVTVTPSQLRQQPTVKTAPPARQPAHTYHSPIRYPPASPWEITIASQNFTHVHKAHECRNVYPRLSLFPHRVGNIMEVEPRGPGSVSSRERQRGS